LLDDPKLSERLHQARAVSSFWQRRQESDLSSYAYALRYPWTSLLALIRTFRLPLLSAELSTRPDGQIIRAALERKHYAFGVSLAASGVCALPIPPDAKDYCSGSHRQTLRRKVRSAQKGGVRWRSVDDHEERLQLLDLVHRVLPNKARYAYTNDQAAYMDGSLWTVALGPDDEPLVLAVTPCDGKWALLQFFTALGESRLHSDARYYLTRIVVERLASLGVRVLVDSTFPHRLSAGLWHFQRMAGFTMARVRLLEAGDECRSRLPVSDDRQLCEKPEIARRSRRGHGPTIKGPPLTEGRS
jgi:hypothetical protein